MIADAWNALAALEWQWKVALLFMAWYPTFTGGLSSSFLRDRESLHEKLDQISGYLEALCKGDAMQDAEAEKSARHG